MSALLDTSALIGLPDWPAAAAISVASLAELHFGLLATADPDERARRAQRLAAVEATFNPLPVDARVGREWGRLLAAVRTRGGSPRRGNMDLAIAATANIHRVPLVTYDIADFQIVDDLVDLRTPADGG